LVEARHAHLKSFYGVVQSEIDRLNNTIAQNQAILNDPTGERRNNEKLHSEAKMKFNSLAMELKQ